MRVLAVDDDAVARLAMQGMVTALGHECILAPNGHHAWQILQTEPMDVVITDRIMPDMDGLELCRLIRQTPPQTGYLYIVLASGMGEDDQARDGMLSGADDYLAKPLQLQQLERKLIAADRVTTLHQSLATVNDELRQTTIRDALTNRRLSDANRLQSDMMAMLGHDARQPLSAVIGFTEATIDRWETTPDDTKRTHLARAVGAARRLDQLIEDVLTMANLESGTISCRPQPVTVEKIIHDAITTAAGQTSVTLTGDVSAHALVDPWHLRQIMANLIGNATKYGTPPVEVIVQPTGQALDIEVRDHGEGIPPDFIPRLFDRFARAETGIATRKPGSGFGLYIARRLTEVNNGRIAYHPTSDQGACFTLTLPRTPASPDCEPPANTPPSGMDGK